VNLRSIRFRITAWYAALLAGALVLFGASIYLGLQRYLYSDLEQTLAAECGTIETQLLSQHPFKRPGWLQSEIEEAFTPEANGHFIRVIQEGVGVVFVSGTPKDGSFDPSPVSLPTADQPQRPRRVRQKDGHSLMIVSSRFTAPDGTSFITESGFPNRQIEIVLDGLVVTFGVYMPFLVLLAIISGYWLMRRSLRPVDDITRRAEGITSTNLSQRLPVIRSGDELERLSSALNRMIARLEEAFQHIHRFSADASHELRTPLTILQLELEGLAQHGRLDPALADHVGSALEETSRMSHIVENLLTIARLDAGQLEMDKTRLDLGQLVSSTTDQMRLLAEEKSIILQCNMADGIYVEGDRSRLQQVIVNLVDNAIKYTQEGGEVEVRIRRDTNAAILEVSDNGAGISAYALPHVFERFFRADKARSRDLGGAGLGLAIVKSICIAHGAEIRVSSQEGRGSCFTLELPALTVANEMKPTVRELLF
jgi:heavy metal sensor kinase